ncbi:x-linked inhibitor of apoptosis [Trichonephila clavipes]|nr:x-linked inhibitor of apoptosis [Trichonephila clavipes]
MVSDNMQLDSDNMQMHSSSDNVASNNIASDKMNVAQIEDETNLYKEKLIWIERNMQIPSKIRVVPPVRIDMAKRSLFACCGKWKLHLSDPSNELTSPLPLTEGQLNLRKCYVAAFPQLKSEEARYSTFGGWPRLHVKVRELVEAGLFYLGEEDYVQCYWCAETFGNWNNGLDPVLEHKLRYKQCGCLTDALYKREIRFRLKYFGTSVLKPSCECLKCKICLLRTACWANLPCGHLVSCDQCLVPERCALCRGPIESRVKIYV